jgi:hypothetical protein
LLKDLDTFQVLESNRELAIHKIHGRHLIVWQSHTNICFLIWITHCGTIKVMPTKP